MSDTPFEEQGAPSLLETGGLGTETIDLNALFGEEPTAPESPTRTVEETSVGKLMRALPIPAFVVDAAGKVTFANRSCGKIAPDYEKILNEPFSSLFPDSPSAEKAGDI